MGRISQAKLDAPFTEFKPLDLSYAQTAHKLAMQYRQGLPIDQGELSKLRVLSALDADHLKGDWLIQLFLGSMQAQPFTRWDKGRRLGISDRLLDKVLLNHLTQNMTAKAFCAANPLSLYTYRSIVNLTVKNEADREHITSRREAIKANFNG
jgi:hypothetical protein